MRWPPLTASALVVLACLGAIVVEAPAVEATIALRASTSTEPAGAATSLLLTIPSGTVAGDVMLAQVAVLGTDNPITAPSGWTLVRQDTSGGAVASSRVTQSLYVRVAGAGETNPTWGLSTAANAAGGILTMQGVDTASPIDTSGAAQDSGNKRAARPALNLAYANSVVVVFAGIEGDGNACKSLEHGDLSYSLQATANLMTPCAGAMDVEQEAGGSETPEFHLENEASSIVQVVALRPPTLAFSTASSVYTEAAGTVNVVVALSGVVTDPVVVAFERDGTANHGGNCGGGTDYTLVTATPATIPAGTSLLNLVVAICDDANAESSETVVITLTELEGAAWGALTVHTLTILDNDQPWAVALDPVTATGASAVGASWGAWTGDPGGAATSANFLKITHLGGDVPASFAIDFTGSSFVGAVDASEAVPINGNVQFACKQGLATQNPQDLTFTFGATSSSGSTTATFTTAGAVIYCQYRLVANLPSPLADQAYQTTYVVT